jgi:hypothetical protein
VVPGGHLRIRLASLLRRGIVVAILALPASAGAHTQSHAAFVAAALPAGHTKVFIGQTSISYVDQFASESGVQPLGGMWYTSAYDTPATIDATTDQIAAAVASHPGLEVSLAVSLGSVSTPDVPRSPLVAAGVYDASIRELGRRIAALPTIVFVRIGYEFDLLGGQYGPPAVFKAAYRHVVDVLRASGVRNAVYVWHSAGAFWRATDPSFGAVGSGEPGTTLHNLLPPPANDPQPITAFYPGRRYVDAFGISYWEDGCCFGRSSQKARDLYETRTREILDQARALGLPLTIAESTPVYVGANSGATSVAWLDQAFRLIEDEDVRLWSLISLDWTAGGGFFTEPFWNGYWPDARISYYPDTRADFLAHTASSRYLFRTGS